MDWKKVINEHRGTISVLLLSGGLYLMSAKETGEVNPIRILNKFEVQHQEETRRRKLYKDIFGKGGYADRNRDNAIDFYEKVGAYRRMGYQDTLFVEGDWRTFPYPKSSELETAIKSYEAENTQQ